MKDIKEDSVFQKRARQKIVHRAAELVATVGEFHHYRMSCEAIAHAQGCAHAVGNSLANEYANFYEQPSGWTWDIYPDQFPRCNTEGFEITRNNRLMLLLWFAEVGPEGIETNV